MSTSPETQPRTEEDRLVTLLSHWLARHVDDAEVRRALDRLSGRHLGPDSAEAVDELRRALAEPAADRGNLERLVRETLEAVALGA